MIAQRLAYYDADDTHAMASDASVCRRESHLAHLGAHTGAAESIRRAVAMRTVIRPAPSVSDSAVRVAARLFD